MNRPIDKAAFASLPSIAAPPRTCEYASAHPIFARLDELQLFESVCRIAIPSSLPDQWKEISIRKGVFIIGS